MSQKQTDRPAGVEAKEKRKPRKRVGRAAAAPQKEESKSGGHPLTLAVGPVRRARGLLFERPREEALILLPCNDVHTVGMRRRIDVAFVDGSGNVLEAHRDVGSCRRLRHRRAVAVVERFSTCASPWFAPGDRIGMVRVEGGSR